MVADPTTTLQVKNTGSLSVNRYGWINIWMAILGQFFTRFPLFFESCLILLK
ncbi:TPA: protein YqgD, partial [Shigella flexneri 2a]